MKQSLQVFFFSVLGVACHHESDAAPVSPSSPVDAAAVLATDSVPDASLSSMPPPASSDAGVDASVAEDSTPKTSPPDMSAAPAYPPSALYDAFYKAKQKLIACYLPGKAQDPKLRGKVIVKFTVNTNGSVKPVSNEGSTLTDEGVINCVIQTVKGMHFTKPVEGSVTVVYPLIFRPTGDETLILPDAGRKKP